MTGNGRSRLPAGPSRVLPPVSSAATPSGPATLRLDQAQHGRAQVQHRRHQCHRHDQRLRDVPTHLLPRAGRTTLGAGTDGRHGAAVPETKVSETVGPVRHRPRSCGCDR